MYEANLSTDLIDYLKIEARKNQVSIRKYFKSDIEIIENLLNFQYKIASQYLWTLNAGLFSIPKDNKILFAAFHKNLFSLYTSMELNLKGFSGSSRIILRNVFEYLMYAKYSSLSKNDQIFDSWIKGEPLSLKNDVINRIKKPDTSAFKKFRDLLNSSVHSSKYSQQVSTSWKDNENDIGGNFVLLKVLLECNYHLLNSHLIISIMCYYAEKYGDNNLIKSLKTQTREFLTLSKKDMLPEPKKLISTYKRSWEVI